MKELIHQCGAWIVFALEFLESIGRPLPRQMILVALFSPGRRSLASPSF
jgi:hypothetical protein